MKTTGSTENTGSIACYLPVFPALSVIFNLSFLSQRGFFIPDAQQVEHQRHIARRVYGDVIGIRRPFEFERAFGDIKKGFERPDARLVSGPCADNLPIVEVNLAIGCL